MKIQIFHSNDMHGRVERMAQLAHMVHRLRKEAEAQGWTTFYWDAGDAADRRFELFSSTKGKAVAPILAAMGCTLQTLGNAIALPYGPEAIARVAIAASFPILGANFRDGDAPLPPGIRASVVLPQPAGPSIGVFGLTTPWDGLYESFGLRMPDFRGTGAEEVDRLTSAGAGVIVALSHLGLEDDRRLAAAVPRIDLIIGGHSHDLLPEGEIQSGVLIAQAGDYAENVGIVKLLIEDANGRVKSKSAELRSIALDEPQEKSVLFSVREQEKITKRINAQVIGELADDLPLDHFEECPMGNFAADVLRDRLDADLAIVSSGQFQIGLSKGPVTRGDLNKACSSSANPCLMDVNGETIQLALERGLDPAISSYLHHSYRGTPIGTPQISGLRVEYDPSKPLGSKIQRVQVRGERLQHVRTYKMACTDAELLHEHGYLQLPTGHPVEHEVPTIIGEALEEALHTHSPVHRPAGGRWVITNAENPSSSTAG